MVWCVGAAYKRERSVTENMRENHHHHHHTYWKVIIKSFPAVHTIILAEHAYASLISPKDAHWKEINIANSRRDYEDDDDDDGPSERVKSTFQDQDS